MKRKNVIIIGASGMDFHTFNVYFRDNPAYDVKCFTMASEQNIGTVGKKRIYPFELAGKLYPNGIPIFSEEEIADLIKEYTIDEVVFAYSDISYIELMQKASICLSSGANFILIGPSITQLKSKKPVISICAVRTGCGKSQTSRKICHILKGKGYKVVAVREPMPYEDLKQQACQRFEKYEDLDKYNSSIEEREEYEPYVEQGLVIYAGVDYGLILRQAEKEADIIVWDGGNNEISFYQPDLLIVLTDPFRPTDGTNYYPGEVNLRMADFVLINKQNTASQKKIELVNSEVQRINPKAVIINAESPVTLEQSDLVKGKRVLVIEDGPTVTHGNMPYGAGKIAAEMYGAAEIIDPKSCAFGSILKEIEKNPHLDKVLPSMGYSDSQIKELEDIINSCTADLVVSGIPIDLQRILKINKPILRARYTIQEIGSPTLEEVVDQFLKKVSD